MFWYRRKPDPDPRPDRVVLAEALRQLASGRIANFDFEKLAVRLKSRDRAIDEMFVFAWLFYDDFKKHRLTGPHALTREHRRLFARCCLFLRTQHPYELSRVDEPLTPPKLNRIFSWLLKKHLDSERFQQRMALRERTKQAADGGYWPFSTRTDYNEALEHPVYLAGVA